jgi:putative inorganic carbon (HCO3(-)) transporter
MAVREAVKPALATADPGAGRSLFAIRMLIFFLVLEYVRPPVLPDLKLQMLIVVLMVVLWLGAKDRPWSKILTAQVLFLAVCALAIPFASNNFAAYFTTRTMFGHVVIALGMSWLLATFATFRRVAWAWLLIMGYAAVFGLFHGGQGPGAMLGDENDLALGCATAFPFAFYGFERLSGARRWLCGAIGALLVAAIVVSFSRGGFVALVAVGLYCWVASRHKIRALLAVLAAAGLLMVVAPEVGRTGESYTERIMSMFETSEGTAEGRRFLWAAARNMWKAHPILGVGGGNFPFLVGQYQSLDFDKPEYLERDWSGTATHSLYFQILAEHGSVGSLLFAIVIGAHFVTIRRLRRLARRHPELPPDVRRDADLYGGALGGAVAGYLAAGAFLSVAYYPYLWYFSAMAVALETAVSHEVAALRAANR